MGSIVNRGATFRAVVRINGDTKTKTFPTKREAAHWITQTEAAIANAPRITRGVTLGSVLEWARLAELAKPYKVRGAAQLFTRLAKDCSDTDLKDCSAAFWQKLVAGWDVSPYSRMTNLARIKGALSSAEVIHDVTVDWEALRLGRAKLARAGLIAAGRPRTRRVTDEEIKAIKRAAADSGAKAPHADIIDFAILTCMRQAEIFRLTWEDLNSINGNPMIWIRDRKDPKRKMGNDQNIPLLGNAAAIIRRQPRMRLKDGSLDPRIFPFKSRVYGNSFTVMTRRAGIHGVHFHDLRHEGVSRLFEQGFGIQEVCLVSGHKNWETLRAYTHTSSDQLHRGPIAHRRAA